MEREKLFCEKILSFLEEYMLLLFDLEDDSDVIIDRIKRKLSKGEYIVDAYEDILFLYDQISPEKIKSLVRFHAGVKFARDLFGGGIMNYWKDLIALDEADISQAYIAIYEYSARHDMDDELIDVVDELYHEGIRVFRYPTWQWRELVNEWHDFSTFNDME